MRLFPAVCIFLLVCYHQTVESKKKKSKSKFSFDALLSGMDLEEKKMFKEELEREVKKFHIPSKHKPSRQNASKRSKVHQKHEAHQSRSRAPVTPGVCDPICEHQCVHGCDFRCCIPHYQVTHRIPRPLPHVSLPGACSTSCSPTCYPECTLECCAGGPSGMFQSSRDLQILYPPTCAPPCPGHCFPHCEPGCCEGTFSSFSQPQRQPVPRLSYPPPQTYFQPSSIMQQPMQQPGFSHCGGQCPQSCAPSCLTSCCMLNRSPLQIMSPPQMMPQAPPPPQLIPPAVPPHQQLPLMSCSGGCPITCAPLCQPSCCNQAPQTPPSSICPGSCPAICFPACSPTCCNSQFPQQPLMLSIPQVRSQPNPVPPIPSQQQNTVRSEAPKTCPASCPNICLPDCSDVCCNPEPHSEIEKKSKISKIAAQLAMLRKKHR